MMTVLRQKYKSVHMLCKKLKIASSSVETLSQSDNWEHSEKWKRVDRTTFKLPHSDESDWL